MTEQPTDRPDLTSPRDARMGQMREWKRDCQRRERRVFFHGSSFPNSDDFFFFLHCPTLIFIPDKQGQEGKHVPGTHFTITYIFV